MAMLKALARRFWKPLLASCATCALGIAVMAGLSGGCLSIETSTYNYLDAYDYYDGCVTTEVTAEDQVEALSEVDGVAHVEARMAANTTMLSPRKRHLSIRGITYTPDDRQRFKVWESVDAKGHDAVSLEVEFARGNGISAGDEVQVLVDEEYRSYLVESLVSCPETLSVRAYDNVSTFNSDFGYVYVPIALVEKEPNVEREEALADLDEREDELDQAKDEAKQAYDQALEDFDSSQDTIDQRLSEVQAALDQASVTSWELDNKEEDVRGLLNDLNDTQYSLESRRSSLKSERAQLSSAKDELESAAASLERAQQQLAQVDGSLAQARSARDAIVGGDAAVAAQLLGMVDPGTRLDGSGEEGQAPAPIDGWGEAVGQLLPYAGGASTVGELLAAYNQACASAEAAVNELEASRNAIVGQLAGSGISEAGLGEAIQQQRAAANEAAAGIGQVDAATAEIDRNLSQLASKREELNGALNQIAVAREELQKVQAQAQEGKAALAQAQEQLDAKRREAKDQWVERAAEFSDLSDEIKKAVRELDEWEGYQAFHNQYLLWFDEGADPRATLAAVEAALAPTEIKSSFVFEDSSVKTRLDNNFIPLRTLSYFVPAVFFAVVLLVIFLFMTLIVRHSRVDIGILRALGKSTAQVRGLFCGLGLLVTIGAVPLGLAIGWGVMRYVSEYFADFFMLPEHVTIFDVRMLSLSIVLTGIVVQVATLIGTALVSRIEPSEAFSRAVPAATDIPRIVQRLTSRMDELSKFSVLSLLRNPLRVCFSVICMAASVALILAAQSFLASKNHILHDEFDQRLHYDCQIFFSDEPDAEFLDMLKGLDYVNDVEVMGFYNSEVRFGDESEHASVNALLPGTDLVRIYDANGKQLEVPDEGIVLEEHLAKKLGVSVGDTVYIDDVPCEVRALSKQDMNRVQYLSLEQAKELDAGELGCVICNIARDDQQRLLSVLTQRDDYVFVVFTDVLYESNLRLFATYDVSAWILTSFAVLIGAFVVFNIMQTSLIERKRELCVLRTLGFDSWRLSCAMFAQTLVQLGFSLIVGLPLGKLIAVQAFMRINTPDRSYEYVSGLREYALTALIVLVYAVVSHALAMRSMRRWDINEGVRDRE